MSDKMRWRYGDTNPVVAAVGSATVIEIGDLLWQATDFCARPVADAPNDQAADAFLGVATQRSQAGDTNPVRVAATGVFEFDLPEDFTGSVHLGDKFGLCGDSERGYGFSQKLDRVETAALAIGRAATNKPDTFGRLSSVLVDIRSRVMTNGVL